MKITKEKIKEVEEEWQSNLLNWKSKRRSGNNLNGSGSNISSNNNNNNNGSSNGSSELLDQGSSNENDDATTRKVKTFTEILSEKAKSGHRLGYNLRRYVATDDEEDDEEVSEIRMIQARNPHRSESDCAFLWLLLILFDAFPHSLYLEYFSIPPFFPTLFPLIDACRGVKMKNERERGILL